LPLEPKALLLRAFVVVSGAAVDVVVVVAVVVLASVVDGSVVEPSGDGCSWKRLPLPGFLFLRNSTRRALGLVAGFKIWGFSFLATSK
jgi:hypothetical protein